MTSPVQHTALERWKQIGIQHRLMGLFVVVMAAFTLALDLRPDNPVSLYWQKHLGVRPDFVVLIFAVCTFAMPLVWYLFRTLFVLSLVSLPLTGLMVALVWQIATDAKLPLVYAVGMGSVAVFAVLLFYWAKELEDEKAVNRQLVEENIRLRAMAVAPVTTPVTEAT